MHSWQHQTNKPLFPDVVWSRPETKYGAGKIAIIGGSAGAMSTVASTYTQAEQAGAGTIRLLVPDSLAKVTKGLPHVEYAPSNPSGGFAKNALAELITVSNACDGVLLAGDMGKNSETSLMLESYLEKYTGLLTISSESIESFSAGYIKLLKRPQTLVCVTMKQLQQMVIELKFDKPVTSAISRQQLAEILHEISSIYPATLLLETDQVIWVASGGKVVDCKNLNYSSTKATIWAIQQPTKHFEALVSSVLM